MVARDEWRPGARGLGLDELRSSTLRLVALWAGPTLMGFLVLASADLDLRQRADMWLVVLGIAGMGVLVYWLANSESKMAAPAFVGGLFANVALVLALYPGTQMIYCLALVSVAAGIFLNATSCVALSVLMASVGAILTLTPAGPWPAADAGPLTFQIAAGGLLAWLGGRPLRVALDWYWSSYVQAYEKTEELRTHRAELVRLSQQLTMAVNRLEEANYQLDRARREADAARRLKGEFATAISHELRTPLNLVIGFSEMLDRETRLGSRNLSPARLHSDVEAIHRNACHISDLINDVLDLSRIEAHRFALQKRPVMLQDIIEDAVEAVRGLFDEAAVALRTRLADDLPMVNADPVRARQVLINLLANAARHTEEGSVEVTAERDGNQILVSVTDSGVGIPPEDLPWVFEEFRQAGDPRRRRAGSGLGLAVTRHFVEMHGGNIWVESTVGVGSTFSFSLPLQEHVVSVAAILDRSSPVGAVPASPKLDRVLMVAGPDDEPFRLFRSYLDGFEVIATPSIAEADLIAQDSGASALILAHSQPADVLRFLTTTNPAVSKLPILSCSIRSPIRLDPDLGVADYLVKPVSRETLASAIRRIETRPRSVLVVDDDPDFRDLVVRTIRQEFRRCRVLQADDGATALAVLSGEAVDVILLDLLMPGTDGYDMIRARRDDRRLRAIPVVVVSARGLDDETIKADSLTLSRSGGLSLAEVMRCSRACLAALLNPSDSSEQASIGARSG